MIAHLFIGKYQHLTILEMHRPQRQCMELRLNLNNYFRLNDDLRICINHLVDVYNYENYYRNTDTSDFKQLPYYVILNSVRLR